MPTGEAPPQGACLSPGLLSDSPASPHSALCLADKEMHFWIQNVLILIGSIFILLFVLTMMRMER